MSMTITYRKPGRPDEASMTMILEEAKVIAAVKVLERRGFVVDKITAGLRSVSVIEDK